MKGVSYKEQQKNKTLGKWLEEEEEGEEDSGSKK